MDQPTDAEVDNLPPTPIVLPPVVHNVIPPSGFSGDDNKPPPGSCWQFTHAGTCDLDEKDCRTGSLILVRKALTKIRFVMMMVFARWRRGVVTALVINALSNTTMDLLMQMKIKCIGLL